ncbi:hypothetical protein NAEGRDRAFT_78525 [Naegleria gruberi]|uniref:F-box domain-containing protein n=1 Tax=Naegleria gruberi TaxID=5762 RepID=D2V4D4_NAEGR|nr:uncharacterized protein NAEGRDRAFT_78525 [Naegleria gruberi]EFC48366.1 hypothetical protein NAEGRDRAFT_78525 [Naegleria gruberi]|eukprot:XP_002681110.1 hypothetical protein NAEGRDRAFT_78525 [Naegleria gruberi strain NEG-M]
MKRTRDEFTNSSSDDEDTSQHEDDSPPTKKEKETPKYRPPIGALLVAGYGACEDEFTIFTLDQADDLENTRGRFPYRDYRDAYERKKERNIRSWTDNYVKNDDDRDRDELSYLQIPSQNLIKQIPCEILLDCMFYMDKYALFNFIQTCSLVYELFDEVYGESIERLRLDILNKKRSAGNLNRLVDLFSNSSSWNESLVQDSNKKVMMTYDQYFRMKSSSKWPTSYFHDHLKFRTFKKDDPMIDLINNQALTDSLKFQEMSFEEYIDLQKDSTPILPYGLLTQPDTYYLTFDNFVKRRCSLLNFEQFALEGDDRYKSYIDGLLKVETVILPHTYSDLEEVNGSLSGYSWYPYFTKYQDYHFYMDSISEKKDLPKRYEKIVRFFKNPYEMTFSDFQDRFKNEILRDYELARILFYDCAFEHNKTTKTKERFVISGGSLLHTLTGCGFSDFDLFIINNGESDEIITQAIKQVLLKLEGKTKHLNYNIMSSKATINICQEGNENIQIVLLKYDTIEELLLFFDLDCCKLVYDGERVLTVLECLRSLKYKINFIHRESGGKSEVHHERALKYGNRGFLTIVADSFHPLSHVMHCDFIVERIRKILIEKYAKQMQSEGINTRYNNPMVDLFIGRNKTTSEIATVDLDESNLLYPVVLKNISFKFVEQCLTNGLLFAVREMESEVEAEKEMLKRLKLDEYEFAKNPSDLFQILPENQNLVKAKYSYSHLVCKFSIVHCQNCSIYFYCPFASSVLREQRKKDSCNGHLIPFLENQVTKENYDPKINTLCQSCLNQLNCLEKYDDFILYKEYRNTRFVENQIETKIIQTIYKIEKIENLKGVSQDRILHLLSKTFSLPDLEYTLKILKFKELVISSQEEDEIKLTLRSLLPIWSYSNKIVVPIPISEKKQKVILDFFKKK